ncbi:hypothetical protein VXE32_006987 [Burkholderia cepacia]|nr:hypothetical protein [Burkholderia cepacia]
MDLNAAPSIRCLRSEILVLEARKMLPKNSKKLRSGPEICAEYPAVIALALAREVGDSKHAVKRLARLTGASERTVQNWLTGVRGPSGPHLITLSMYSTAVHWAYLSLSERIEDSTPNASALVGLLKEALGLLTNQA